MHERLAAEDGKERITHLLGFANHPVHRVRFDPFLLRRDVYPATLTSQVAAIDDRNVQEGRKELAAFEPAFVLLNRPHTLPAHVPHELPDQTLVGLKQQSLSEAEVHDFPYSDGGLGQYAQP